MATGTANTSGRRVRLAVAAIMVVSFWCKATPGALSTPSRLDRILDVGEVRVCVWPEYYSLSWKNPRTFELEGLDVDMAHALAERLRVRLRFVESSFAALVENMQNDACDIAMHGVGVLASRMPYMAFSTPYVASDIVAVAEVANEHIGSWADIDREGVVVAAQRGTFMEAQFHEHFADAELLVVDAFRAREQAVLSGRADVFLTDFPYALRMEELHGWAKMIEPDEVVALTPYAYAVPMGDPAWLDEVNAFLATVRADGRLRAAAARHGLLPIYLEPPND